MERKLVSRGFEVVEDTARRKKHHADRVMRHPDTGIVLTIDHKSTVNENNIILRKEWFDKVKSEAAEGSIPAITISLKGRSRIYVIFDIEDLEGVMY